jgi:hypothetical protein
MNLDLLFAFSSKGIFHRDIKPEVGKKVAILNGNTDMLS